MTALGGTASVSDDDEVVDPFGDADGNGQRQAFDAAQVLLHVLSPFLTGLDSLSANVDLQAFDEVVGQITPFDASLILQQRVGLIARFPVQLAAADNHPQPETANAAPKRGVERRVLALEWSGDYLAVVTDERSGIVSGEVVLEGVGGRVEMGAGLEDFLSASKAEGENLRVVFAGAQSVSGPGELLRGLYRGGARCSEARSGRL